jgi:DNA modification methylase
MTRRATATSAFGVSRRESHDARGFYDRFTRPEISKDEAVAEHRAIDKLVVGDARHMDEVPDASVALVVTSPPYFAGKEYEEALGEAGVPATYLEYLELLREVFAECVRTLEPGGRIAVNVANLGRRPYRSLSADVTRILQDDLRLLLRGEIIWLKQRGSAGSCAWGSFQRPANPVLRDLTERIIVASKGRFDRAISPRRRARLQLPSVTSMTREDFMENTLDLWEIPAESATRIGHPAPFPVELPARLIDLYTYEGDLVLDPFCGSGTTAVAAVRAKRHFVGYDLDETYVRIAEARLAAERERAVTGPVAFRGALVARALNDSPISRAIEQGRLAKELARELLEEAGFSQIEENCRLPGGIEVTFTAHDRKGCRVHFEVAGSFTSHRPGLLRADVLWKALAKAAVVHEVDGAPLILLTPAGPAPNSPGAQALACCTGVRKPLRAVVEILRSDALASLRSLCDHRRLAEAALGRDRRTPELAPG